MLNPPGLQTDECGRLTALKGAAAEYRDRSSYRCQRRWNRSATGAKSERRPRCSCMQTLHDIAYLQRWLGSFNVQGLLLMSRYGSSTSTASALSLPLSRTPCARSSALPPRRSRCRESRCTCIAPTARRHQRRAPVRVDKLKGGEEESHGGLLREPRPQPSLISQVASPV